MKHFKRRVSESYSVLIPRNIRSLILCTERGAARHAKMLDTDIAWNVFERLEDNYFTKHDNFDSLSKNIPHNSSTEELIVLVDKLQKVIHEGDFIPAGQAIHEYNLPKTGKTLSNQSKITNVF